MLVFTLIIEALLTNEEKLVGACYKKYNQSYKNLCGVHASCRACISDLFKKSVINDCNLKCMHGIYVSLICCPFTSIHKI